MKQLNLVMLLYVLLLVSCTKRSGMSGNTGPIPAAIQMELKDSLSPGDYRLLDFSQGEVINRDSPFICLLRIPLAGQPIAGNFLVVSLDRRGHIKAGRFVQVSAGAAGEKMRGKIIHYRGLAGQKGTGAGKPVTGQDQLDAGSRDEVKADQTGTNGGDLPPVIVSYTVYPDAGISYADWYNLLEMSGDEGFPYEGYYSPSDGGGGGGGTASAYQVDFEAPESKDAIDIKKYMDCFGNVQDAGATYTVTICVDLPVDDDPTKIFNWSDASPGHTFIELYKNGTGGLVQQVFGFYPDQPWKTVAGGQIAAKVADDAGHEYQAKYTIGVSASQFASAVQAAESYANFDYNVASFNCADYALKVFSAAGGKMYVPPFAVPGYSQSSNTPQGVYDAIKGLVLDGNANAMANGQKQWVGDSHGACN
ncbi:MAG TPA: hypothetical protein VG738_19615 [Chitinophagaceae bacterium]|nr:hypothetical protein [Chitinophagaceae bacterium]